MMNILQQGSQARTRSRQDPEEGQGGQGEVQLQGVQKMVQVRVRPWGQIIKWARSQFYFILEYRMKNL